MQSLYGWLQIRYSNSEHVSKWSRWALTQSTKMYTGKTQTHSAKCPYIQFYPGGWAESSFFNGCRVLQWQMLFVTGNCCQHFHTTVQYSGYLVINNRVVRSTGRGLGFHFQDSHLQFQGKSSDTLFLASLGTRHKCGIQTNIQAKHTHTLKRN